MLMTLQLILYMRRSCNVRAKFARKKLHATCCMVYGGLKDHSLSVGVARVGLFCKLPWLQGAEENQQW